ncbi:DUF397 domain-containing protein [Streptomyces acidiscabies]|uniref:DUF397 domain-containing protein n=1 Tax=Streptomyces acidiscabies TaxID=42234 RepID=A0AAP6EL51_9ACTN|nr:DUF397 domain-containing protein [Streptomyces acidiscabies]MDX2966261.1 DUF397 domain-containing protein [Streptomyces acidiscabies]MDX3796320.1 DUF397 domain-containing protein [Streptomyces acidiscabies]
MNTPPEIEFVTPFRKSSYSAQHNDCVELARTAPEGHAVRDSKQPPSAPVHFFTPQAWTPFIQALRPPSTPLARPREML